MARFYREQRKVLKATGKSGVTRLKNKLEKLGKVASYGTYNSIYYQEDINISTNKAKVEIFADEAIDFIDQGRKPRGKQPPPQVIRDWINEINLVFTLKSGKPMPIKQQVFLIGRAIARDGIEPTGILDKVFNSRGFNNLLDRRLKKASLKDIQTRIDILAKEV